MQIFIRDGTADLVQHYEYFLMNYNWSSRTVPDAIGDWELLAGHMVNDLDGPVQLAAVYQSGTEDHAKVIYIELDEQILLKMVVGSSLAEISGQVSSEVLAKIHFENEHFRSEVVQRT